MKRPARRSILLAAALLLGAPPSRAQRADDLSFFEEEARVITASRRWEPAREAPVAVDVITADDIRHSGAVNLWDLLRFRVGMDVADGRSGEGNRALVTVRGFPAEFVDKLLVLIDGRSVYTGLSGGAVWDSLPVQPQDIERIEIVRGPNAALHGSNAGLGVVNIITLKPQEKLTASAEALGGNRGLHREQVSFEDSLARGAYRLSFLHKAIDPNSTPTGARGSDDFRSYKGNARAAWRPAEDNELELFSGGTRDVAGVMDAANPRGAYAHHFQMLRHGWERHADSAVQTTLSRRDDRRRYAKAAGGSYIVREYQYDAESQHRLDWLDGRMRTVYGVGLRYNGIESAEIFSAHPYQKNALQRAFGTQSWRVHEKLNLIAALSLENSDSGGFEPSYQFAAVANPAEAHTLRASYGRASTIPTLYQKAARHSPGILLLGNPGIKPQRLHSYEAGYKASFLDGRLSTETNLFYMDLERLGRTITTSFFPVFTLGFDNSNRAIARGVEAKAGWRWGAGRSLYANYTHETISDAKGVVNVRRGTPVHKFNAGGYAPLPGLKRASLGLNAGYKDGHTLSSQSSGQTLDIPTYWRADARLAYAPREGVELFLACQNMLRERHIEFSEWLEVPRTYQAGVTVKFAANGGRP